MLELVASCSAGGTCPISPCTRLWLYQSTYLRHGCDEALCQRPEHLAPSYDDNDNRLEWMLRRHRIGSPHRDVRGASGRARAIRAAVLADGDVAQALRDGQPALDALQPTLF